MERELGESMERRDALKLTGALLIAGSMPWWLGCGVDKDGARALHDSPLSRALDAARLNGKPVLVFVEPSREENSGLVPEMSMLGMDVAEAFERGGDELLLDLSLCELACASPLQVAAACGATVEPATVGLLEHDGPSVRWTRVDWCRCVPPFRMPMPDKCASWDDRLQHNIAGLRSALAASETMLAARASAARLAIGAAWVKAFEARVSARKTIDSNELDFAAALVRRTPGRNDLRSLLIDATRERALGRGPAGSRWVDSESHGYLKIRYRENDEETARRLLDLRVTGALLPANRAPGTSISACGLCGMAATDKRGLRFLLFYVDEP